MEAAKLSELLIEIESIISYIEEKELLYKEKIDTIHIAHQESALNLIHYLSLRSFDIAKIQKKLGELGISRLAKAEGHILNSLYKCHFYIKMLLGEQALFPEKGITTQESKKLTRKNTKQLFGYRKKGRRVRIMVTLPSEAAYNYELVYKIAAAGMNCARINCAHDTPEVWHLMIDNVKKAAIQLKKRIKITMDLGGPKIRTGALEEGLKIKKITPNRDDRGNIIHPANIKFTSNVVEKNDIPVYDKDWLSSLQINDKITLKDTRGKEHKLKVSEIQNDGVSVKSNKTIYFETNMVLTTKNGATTTVGELPEIQNYLNLHTGDELLMYKEAIIGKKATIDNENKVIRPACISCTSQEVFSQVSIGDPIYFDDGKVPGEIIACSENEIKIKIGTTKPGGAKLKSDKGINLPASKLNIHGLTSKDKQDLVFVAEHADVVNFSFVNTAEDVKQLHELLQSLNVDNKLGVILKIETNEAFNNFSEILLEAMKLKLVGVMIARGDLAIEVGWENIGWVQREILAICNAAHIPVVWATQVLENMAKKGLPSRSEITDTTQSLKAECVMLNKGPYIVNAIRLLDTILTKLEKYQSKNDSMSPSLSKL